MKTVAFYTLGCKVNQYETDAMAGLFKKQGYKISDFKSPADIYVINTCAVTEEAARKSRQVIRRAVKMNPDAVIAVVGCYSQIAAERVLKIPGVDLVIGSKNRHQIVELVEKLDKTKTKPLLEVEDIMKAREFEEIFEYTYKEKTRAFLKIQEGCNQFCTYCIIPYARGPIRSRRPENVFREAENLAKQGFKEVVITGVHLGAYGKELKDENVDIGDIVEEISKIEGIERIRISSIEPMEITDDLIERLAGIKKVCRHYHIPLQSGSKKILKWMNRRYTPDNFRHIVDAFRSKIPEVSISTDIMVGFPGETDELFDETMRFVEDVTFSRIHVFKYSKRAGTPAANFPNQVTKRKKEERSHKLIKLAQEQEKEYNKRFLGKTLKVLIEQEMNTGEGTQYEGLSDNYIRIYIKHKGLKKGEIYNVKIKRIENSHVIGELI
ncbi:MAG: threonylcarbamoyladenosine tRNA methylthiotransferase MtaB [Thermosediminibacterales bacterium]|nr:threonylcarbamoyladenosine tRNA methylthiotransferase MtaB [Thermosediminibacterales bacterium]